MYPGSYVPEFSAVRGFFRLQRPSRQVARIAMASILPFHPCFSPGLRVFASRRPFGCFQPNSDLSCPFAPPSASLTFKPRQRYRPWSTPKPVWLTPRLSFFALKHLYKKEPFFSYPFGYVRKTLLFLPEASPSGLATRSMRVCNPFKLGSLFQLLTLLGFPSRSFAPLQRSKKSFLFSSTRMRF